MITTQLPTKAWHEAIGEPKLADAICDRLVHNARVFVLKGSSIQKKKELDTQVGDKDPS